ncbi:hypothetical protein VNO80_18547 [Phaseolus coccineus]|uniref:Uncharacterized protein n=1 Tax=Phaseolus coccineus TaxID=3886 RepID=A0AAN9MKM0_PHACN
MEGLQNIDGEFEADNLDMFFDWNDDHFIPTFLESERPIAALEDPNLMENFYFQIEAAPVNPSTVRINLVLESIDVAQSQVQPTDPMSLFSQGPSTAVDFTFVPNPLPPPAPNTSVLNGTQLSNSLSSPEGMTLEGEAPSFRGQDVTQTGRSNQFSASQNENLQLKDLHSNGDQNRSNQLSVPNTFEINNFNGLNINQSSLNPAMVHANIVQVTPAIETYSTGVLAPPQRPAFFPLQNHISNSAWNSSRPQHTQFSPPDMYGAPYAPNHMQLFSTVHNQVGHSSELQHIHGLQSQNSRWPVNPMYPRLEPYSDLDTAFVTMPSIPYQRGFRPMLPEPAVRSAVSLANYGQQPSLFVIGNSHGSGSSVPPTNQMFALKFPLWYSPLYQNQNQGHYHHPQVMMMPNNQGQQSSASMQQWSQGVSNHISKYNQRMNTPNLQRHSNTSSRVTEASSSRLSISREAKIAPVLRSEPSEAIRRILDMNPSRLISRCITAEGSPGRVRYQPPPRGRPPKRRYEEYFQREKLHKVSSEIGNAGTSSTSLQAQHIPYSYQNAIATNAPSAPRQFVNSVCDIEHGRIGHPIDPQPTLFKPQPVMQSSAG